MQRGPRRTTLRRSSEHCRAVQPTAVNPGTGPWRGSQQANAFKMQAVTSLPQSMPQMGTSPRPHIHARAVTLSESSLRTAHSPIIRCQASRRRLLDADTGRSHPSPPRGAGREANAVIGRAMAGPSGSVSTAIAPNLTASSGANGGTLKPVRAKMAIAAATAPASGPRRPSGRPAALRWAPASYAPAAHTSTSAAPSE